ncbi:MAG: hypothetical protein ACTSU2_04850 [Promethearchaeota archaeon]
MSKNNEEEEYRPPVGICFILNKANAPDDPLKALEPYYVDIVKHLNKEEIITSSKEYDKIINGSYVYFVRVEKSDYEKMLNDSSIIGSTAIDVYLKHTGVEPSDDVDILIYPKDKAPWGFDLIVSVLFSI